LAFTSAAFRCRCSLQFNNINWAPETFKKGNHGLFGALLSGILPALEAKKEKTGALPPFIIRRIFI